jgi:hypothetical protein
MEIPTTEMPRIYCGDDNTKLVYHHSANDVIINKTLTPELVVRHHCTWYCKTVLALKQLVT